MMNCFKMLLSNFAFKFNSRHCTKASRSKPPRSQANLNEAAGSGQSQKIDLRELARRQFPHASEQELDMLPKQKMFAREAVHSIVPDRLDEAMATLNKPPEAAELFWEAETQDEGGDAAGDADDPAEGTNDPSLDPTKDALSQFHEVGRCGG